MEKANTNRVEYKSAGKREVNSLASRLLIALLPPKKPFFKFKEGDTDA